MFLADLARRLLLLSGLLIFLIPLLSLVSSGGGPSVALVAVLAIMTAARPPSGLLGLALVLPLAFALADVAGSSLTVIDVAESFVLAFIVGALARSILDGRLFMDSRLARPALAIFALVAVSGLCVVFEQFADVGVAMTALWRAARSYFASPSSEYLLRPTLHWLEFAALVPLVEVSVRRRPKWLHVTLIVWLGAGTLAAGQAILRAADVAWPTPAGILAAVNAQVELAKVALEAASHAPVFGIGLGGLVVENAHNSFLQILAELGCAGLVAFVWLLWSAMQPIAVDPQARAARTALVAGLVTFFLSALFWNPLLIYPIAAATFVTLGFAAGTLPARENTSSAGLLGWAEWILVAVVLVSTPWRVSAAFSPDAPEVVGAGPVQPELEGVPYRVAERVSRWRLRPHTRTVAALMRWDPAGATDCRVRIGVRNRPDDEVSLRPDAWIPVRFAIPPGGRPNERPEVEFAVSSATCRLLVGTVTAMR